MTSAARSGSAPNRRARPSSRRRNTRVPNGLSNSAQGGQLRPTQTK
jgi:hypothetical protein